MPGLQLFDNELFEDKKHFSGEVDHVREVFQNERVGG